MLTKKAREYDVYASAVEEVQAMLDEGIDVNAVAVLLTDEFTAVVVGEGDPEVSGYPGDECIEFHITPHHYEAGVDALDKILALLPDVITLSIDCESNDLKYGWVIVDNIKPEVVRHAVELYILEEDL